MLKLEHALNGNENVAAALGSVASEAGGTEAVESESVVDERSILHLNKQYLKHCAKLHTCLAKQVRA